MQQGGNSPHVNLGGLSGALNILQGQVVSATDRLMTIKKCHEEGTFFGTRNDGTEGCIEILPTCRVPWSGAVMQIGESITAYQSATVPYGQTCQSQTRTCDASTATLSGSYTQQTCTVQPGLACTLPWGGTIATGQSVTAYAEPSVPYGSSCTSQTRLCINGTLSGSFGASSCTVQNPLGCALPWGGSIAHSQSVTAYAASSVPSGSSCAGQTRTCTNGTLSGSYGQPSCTVQAPTLKWVQVSTLCLTYYQSTRMGPPCASANPAGQACPTANVACYTAGSDPGCNYIGNFPMYRYACQ